MSLFEEDTLSNPLYLEDATGLDASFDQAVWQDDTDEYLAKKRAKKEWDDFDNLNEEVVYA